VSGHAKMPPASHQVSATSLKLLIQQAHPKVRVERDSGMCVARDLYELGSLNLNMMLKVEFFEKNVAYGLINYIISYCINIFRLLAHPLKKVMTLYLFPPLLLLSPSEGVK
jgi:hypothetical protein